MIIKDFLDEVAYVKDCEISGQEDVPDAYYSKFDDSYITFVGMEDNIKHLADLEITEELTNGVGYSPKDKKWYGWSHRALYGFTIGSTCKKGDCHYIGSSLKEQEESAIRFWSDKCYSNTRCIGIIERDGEKFFDIKWEYNNETPNEKIRGQISGTEHFIEPIGNGEWIAKTMEDAKKMAKDFNRGVS